MKVKELIQKLKECGKNKNFVIYSNENQGLKHYDFFGFYENEGQVEMHIDEGEVLHQVQFFNESDLSKLKIKEGC